MGLISLTKITKNYWFFVICWTIAILRDIVKKKTSIDFKDFRRERKMFNIIYFNISDLLVGILVVITICRSKGKKSQGQEKRTNSKGGIKYIYTDVLKEKLKKFV